MKSKQQSTNILLKKLYSYCNEKQLAFNHILPIHKQIFKQFQAGTLSINPTKINLKQQLLSYPSQNKLKMTEQIMLSNFSVYDIFMGKKASIVNVKEKMQDQRKENQENVKKSRIKEQKQKEQKEKLYQEKMKEWNLQKAIIQKKKKIQADKKVQLLIQEEQKLKRQKQLQQQKQKEQKKRKLEQGLKQIEIRRKKRSQNIVIQKKRSNSLKLLPKYLQLQKQYLQQQREKIRQSHQQQLKKRQSMTINLQQIKAHQKAYIEKVKQKLSAWNKNDDKSQASRKVKSQFNLVMLGKDQHEQSKNREKLVRRKQFQEKVRNIPVSIDINKKKQKEIQNDKMINSQKYQLLANRKLNDDQIFAEFKDFELKFNPKQVGKNYLKQLKNITKPKRQKKLSLDNISAPPKSQRVQYTNYLQQLRAKNYFQQRSVPKISQSDELLQLVQKSKHILKKSIQQSSSIYNPPVTSLTNLSRVSLRPQPLSNEVIRHKQVKAQISKSITQKIAEYQQKVYRKVNDLKKITHYDQNLRQEIQIDQLYTKVLKGKLATLDLD